MWYKIYAGVLGEAEFIRTDKFDCEEEAIREAYGEALEEYSRYEGYHGVPSKDDMMDDPEEYGLSEGYTEEELETCYHETREEWLQYYVEPATGPDDIDE